MTRLWLLLLLGSPPDPAIEPAIEEGPSIMVSPSEPAPTMPEPVVIEPPPEPSVEPPSTAPPPALEPLPPAPQRYLPPPPPPPDGSGRLVGGSLSLLAGLGSFAVLGYEANREGADPAMAASVFVPLGVAGVGAGVFLLVRGSKARKGVLEWRAYTHERERPSGSGLIVGGVVGSTTGGVTLLITSVRAGRGESGPVLTGMGIGGGAALVAGVSCLTIGLLRQQSYRRWRQARFMAMPGIAPMPGGVWLGASGRF